MSGVRSITRRNDATAFYASSGSAPLYVNQNDNSVRVIPAGSGTSESSFAVSAAGVTGNFRFANGSGTLVSGTGTIATGLATVAAFNATVYGATGFASGATEVHEIQVKSITTGSVVVQGIFNSFVTGAATISASGTATFYWLAMGT